MQSFVSRLFTAAVAAIALCASGTALAQKVRLATSAGDIVVELDAAKAPKSVANFLEYVKAGHYNGTIFHRVIENFMIQGGGMTTDMKEKETRPPIPLARKIRTRRRHSSSSTSRTTTSSTRRRPGTAMAMPSSARSCREWTSSTRSAPRPPAPAMFPCSRW